MNNQSQYKISVIVPVYKCESTICRCLDSVLNQSLQDVEIVAVNDCTPDNAMSHVKAYVANNENIRYLELECNSGPMVARQEGVKIATGKYYIFLDSDDTLPEDALETLYNEVQKSGADIVISGFQYVWDNQNRREEHFPKAIGEYTPTETFYKLLDGSLTHNLAFCIFKSDLFKHEYLTIPNQTNGEDLILFYQLVANSKKIKSINFITYNYHQEGSSSTRSPMSLNKLKQLVKVQSFKLQFLKKHGIDDGAIMKNIAPIITSLHTKRFYKKAISELDGEIQSELEFKQVLKYLTVREKIKYIILRLKNLL